jgi:hypothetical protein
MKASHQVGTEKAGAPPTGLPSIAGDGGSSQLR